jgi:hypothetical protein
MSDTLQIDRMTLEDKLRAMEALWDDLCRQPDAVAVPQWQKDLLDARQRLIEEGKARFSDWETARKRIDERTS